MPSIFTWIDHSEAERRRMLDAIELFRERGTRDELGLAGVRDGFADLMFPGTGSLQTRARYFFFVPWMFGSLETDRVSSAEMPRRARQFEVKLINSLAESSDTEGIIGIQKRAALQRMPSSIYWNGLKRLGIRLCSGSQDDYFKGLDESYRRARRAVRNDDGESVGASDRNWSAAIPAPPPSFPEAAELQLSAGEADYLRERIVTEAPLSLFAFVADRSDIASDVSFVWDHPLAGRLPEHLAKQVLHARNFAEVMHGAPILYNIMLAEMEPQRDELLPNLREVFEGWRVDMQVRRSDLRAWNRAEFWPLLYASGARVTEPTRQFADAWIDLVLDAGDLADLFGRPLARDLISGRERRLKRGLARLHNEHARERWNGNSGLARLEYRWRNAQRVLNDMLAAGRGNAGTR